MSTRRPGFERLVELGLATRDRMVAHVSVRRRVQRVQERWWLIIQCAVAAAVSWWIAAELFDKPSPFFAPASAIICLGMSYGRRLRRTVEILVGVAVGVGVGDIFVSVFGVGTWQIAVTVGIALTLAVFLSGAQFVITQAGVQAVIVTTLIPGTGAGLSRWLDALIGGCVALLFATIAPTGPLLRPREEAAEVLHEIAAILEDVAAAAAAHDETAAAATLERARQSEAALEALRHASEEALAVSRSTPGRRGHAEVVREVAAMAEPLDHAIRNIRVLARRSLVATRYDEPIPARYLALVSGLAETATCLADHLLGGRPVAEVRGMLIEVGRDSSLVEPSGSLSAHVVLAQTRSIVVDLLEATGLSYPEAVSLVRPPHASPESADPM